MAEAKTKKTKASVGTFLAKIDDPARRADCNTIAEMMQRITGEPPAIWGDAIVGFGMYRYTYASGHSGDWPVIAFSPRKGDISVYLMSDFPKKQALLAKLGTHKSGKSCLYLKRLAGIDLDVLEELMEQSVKGMEPQRVRE